MGRKENGLKVVETFRPNTIELLENPIMPRIHPTIRFWKKVNKNGPIPAACPELGPCWLWTGARASNGYGNFWDGKRYVSAHVFSYELAGGRIQKGYERHHHCLIRLCVNPSHLQSVEGRFHPDAAPTIQRNRTHCPRGHEYSAQNTYIRRPCKSKPNSTARTCRACAAENQRRYRKDGRYKQRKGESHNGNQSNES